MSDLLETFFKDVSKTPLLSREEEISLSKRIENGDQAARKKMIKANIRLAISIAKKYQTSGCSLEDLIQESNIGLMKAVDRYDWRRGFKFSTYACWWIRQAVRRHVTSHATAVKLPSYARNMLWKMKQLNEEYVEEFGVYPSHEEIADLLGVSPNTLRNMIQCASMPASIEQPIRYGNDSMSGSRMLGDIIPDDRIDDADEKLDKEKMEKIIRSAFATLTDREEKVIRLRFGITEDDADHESFPITRDELAKITLKENTAHGNA